VVVGSLLLVLLLAGLAKLLQMVAPRVIAIARTTAKECLSQPLIHVLLAAGAFFLFLFVFLPYNTLGEDIKVFKDQGLTTIMILGIILALWTASTSVADEIEGRTALTLLSKPVGRREFILGKFLGIIAPVAILFIVLGALFLAGVSYKLVYDARETSQPVPAYLECLDAMTQVIPGLILAFMETIVFVAISVAVSTRLPLLPNLVICSSIYVLGHLVPSLINSSAGQLPLVGFVARLLAVVLPTLDHFNIYSAIATGREVPLMYLVTAGAYCLLYSAVAMLVALLAFENRDLA